MRTILLGATLLHVAFAQPVILTVLNGVSSNASLSPGSWVSIYGANFAVAPQTVQSGTLPTTLGGVSITVGNSAVPLRYVSPSQVNALIPLDVGIPSNTVVP